MSQKSDTNIELDQLDKNILYYLDLNAKESSQKIAKKVNSNKNTVNFRIKRLIQNKYISSFNTEIDTVKLGYQTVKTYLQLQNNTEDTEKEIIAYLKSVAKVGWIITCSGTWDIIFLYWAKDTHEYYNMLSDFMKNFGEYILRKEIIQNIEWTYMGRKWLLDKPVKPTTFKYGGKSKNRQLDKTDKNILKIINKNSHAKINDIAKTLNLHSQKIFNRIKRLEKEKIIIRYSANIDYNKLGYLFCKTLIHTNNISKDKIKEIYDYCEEQPNIFAITTTLGPWDIEFEIEVKKYEDLVILMNKIKTNFSELIRSYETIVLRNQELILYPE
jgi:Lrp/AsnC family transcriptional regulator, leucine-responsive regulatory protein